MVDPSSLYELEPELPELTDPVLLHCLDGFMDAGAAGRLVREHILAVLPHQVLARFDIDQLLDYRARRPIMTFDRDHWSEYEPHELLLHCVEDTEGTKFLFLDGPEPDRLWDAFVTAVCDLAERFSVRLTVSCHGIPMSVPHTRPLGVTPHRTRPELITGRLSWFGRVQVPGSASALLEYRLGQAGKDAAGFAVHVPHYLAQAAYPAAAVTALEAVLATTGLAIPVDTLREAATKTDAELTEQVQSSSEVAGVVQALEQQYDSVTETREGLMEAERNMPTAEELAAQFERFLAEQDGQDST